MWGLGLTGEIAEGDYLLTHIYFKKKKSKSKIYDTVAGKY